MAAPLTGFAADVEVEQVRALLLNRRPDLLDEDADTRGHDLFVSAVRGTASEVAAVVGANPADGPRRDAAIWCTTLGVASLIESSLFPEQQGGDGGRADDLRRRFEAALKKLGTLDDDTGIAAPAGPQGTFPDPTPYPDPARGPAPGWYGSTW